jgi:SET domain-containing protein
MKIIPPQKIYVSESKIHGMGVFASETIEQGEIFEVTPLLDLKIPKGELSGCMIDYRFNWPQGTNPELQVVGWGYGSLYNHSETPNAAWKSNMDNFTFEFYATRKIEKDEEILVYYGDSLYWNDGRDHVQIKS